MEYRFNGTGNGRINSRVRAHNPAQFSTGGRGRPPPIFAFQPENTPHYPGNISLKNRQPHFLVICISFNIRTGNYLMSAICAVVTSQCSSPDGCTVGENSRIFARDPLVMAIEAFSSPAIIRLISAESSGSCPTSRIDCNCPSFPIMRQTISASPPGAVLPGHEMLLFPQGFCDDGRGLLCPGERA